MTTPFTVTVDLGPRVPPRAFDPSLFRSWDAQAQALFGYVARHDGPVTVRFGAQEVRLGLDDLVTVFPDLPGLADRLHHDGGAADLWFAELGTDLRLLLRREGDTVVVTVRTGVGAPAEFAALDGERFVVDAEGFLTAWQAVYDTVQAAVRTEAARG